MKAYCATLLLLALAGCASAPDNPANNPEAVAPLVCRGKVQCDLYWSRAQAYVAATSGYRIRLANDTVIETFGPFGSKVDLAFKVTKIPENAETAQIIVNAACDNFIRCYPTRTDAIVGFKRFVRN